MIAATAYSVGRAIWPHLTGREGRVVRAGALSADLLVCILLVVLSGGGDSPFLPYTLSPVLLSATVLPARTTFGIAALTVAYVVASQALVTFSTAGLVPLHLDRLVRYAVSVALAASLPYAVNINLRQRLEVQGTLQERSRLSREIHDVIAQTLSALRWQAQLLRRRLAQMNIDLDEARQVETLAGKAQQDIGESLMLLRRYTGDGSFLSRLQDYLEQQRQATNINFRLDAEAVEPHLEVVVELELLRICQEALTNVRKHSGANNVWVKLKGVDNHLEVSIADDGAGFDIRTYYHDAATAKGQGLAVMHERAKSVGGRLRVLSLAGRGTEIQVEVPYSPDRGKRWWNR